MLHKLIHPDRTGGLWNMIIDETGRPAFSSGKIFDEAQLCDLLSVTVCRFLDLAMSIAEDIFEPPATSAIGRPLDSSSSTAWRLNSSSERLCG